ncbi:MAG: hypothetical protein IKV50_05430 [Clostridia bacterium]|nr:hypothetical protein [Clostridia bacterium]MBR6553620.1 hypothetical protein [Clostridia bacterium]
MSLAEQYIEKYKAWLNSMLSDCRETVERTEQTLCGVKIEMETHDYIRADLSAHGQLSRIAFTKGELSYTCQCCDDPTGFFPLLLAGKWYICFRRTLYGFVLLSCETLLPEYEYFPKCVLESKESFIVVTVKQIDDLLILGGCYWACPDECFVFDYETKRFLRLSKLHPRFVLDREEVREKTLILYGEDPSGEKQQISLSKDELLAVLATHGAEDF